MWLLKLHFSISILCMLTFVGFKSVYKQQMKENGWINEEKKKKKSIFAYFMFFVPIMNVLFVVIMFLMIGMKKKDFDKMCEDAKKECDWKIVEYQKKIEELYYSLKTLERNKRESIDFGNYICIWRKTKIKN